MEQNENKIEIEIKNKKLREWADECVLGLRFLTADEVRIGLRLCEEEMIGMLWEESESWEDVWNELDNKMRYELKEWGILEEEWKIVDDHIDIGKRGKIYPTLRIDDGGNVIPYLVVSFKV